MKYDDSMSSVINRLICLGIDLQTAVRSNMINDYQMAKKLGLNPKKFGGFANHKQELLR